MLKCQSTYLKATENTIHPRSSETCLGDTRPHSVIILLLFFFNLRLKKHIQISKTDGFIKIKMTTVRRAVQLIEGETLLWADSPAPVMKPLP